MKKIAIFSALLLSVLTMWSQPKTVKFAQRDTSSLFMDIYEPQGGSPDSTCVIFVFGGGFLSGQRNLPEYALYAKDLNQRGYTVVCIDYRLGLKGADTRGTRIISALDRAITMAVEDLYSATAYLLEHAKQYRINPKRIVLCGSSAGAITVLQADYELCNRRDIAKVLPADFHYAGVLSFSGAILSHNGKVKYAEKPAPTFLFHGINDQLVTYKSITFGKLGFFGSNALAKRFEKFDYPYYIRRYEDLGHDVAAFMVHEVEISDLFIRQYVKDGRFLQKDETINDPNVPHFPWGNLSAGKMYNKRDKK